MIAVGETSFVREFFSQSVSQVFNLPELSPEQEGDFKSTKPFPHFVIDNFMQQEVADQIRNCLLDDKFRFQTNFNDQVQRNKTISTGAQVPIILQMLAQKLAASEMLRYLEKRTGLRGLIPDPYFNTDVGYYHIMGSGGVLGSHVDHSHHSTLKIPHVLNLVLYISPDWKKEYGGGLQLFECSGKSPVVTISPYFNTAAIFLNNPISYHGVEPIIDNAGTSRHSLYFAYYLVRELNVPKTKSFPKAYSGSANEEDDTIEYGTHFVVPLFDLFKKKNKIHLYGRLRHLFHMVTPPILVAFIHKIRVGWHTLSSRNTS